MIDIVILILAIGGAICAAIGIKEASTKYVGLGALLCSIGLVIITLERVIK